MTKADVASMCRSLLTMDPLFLDAETTGLGPADQVVEIAVVDVQGRPLYHSLVKPTIPIPADATAIHGITDADVAGAPTFRHIYQQLKAVLDGRVLSYHYQLEKDLLPLPQGGVL